MFVGIDVSKDRLEVHLRPSAESLWWPATARGLAQLTARLATVGPALVVLEATGGSRSRPRLLPAACPLAVVNPARIRAS